VSRYPSATWKPLSGTSTKTVQKDILCFHTMVGYLKSTWTYFNSPDVAVYSHGGIGGIWGSDAAANLDGVAWQMADTDHRAAANLDGNWRIISWETADNAARPIQPWTPKQCDKIVDIIVDAHRLDGIPLVMVPDSKVGRRGVAYHRLGCDPYRVAGGELWSSSYGKDCPTDPRIKQLPGLLNRAIAIVNGNSEDDVSQADVTAALKDFFHANEIKVPNGQTNNDNFVVSLVGMSQVGVNADNALKAAVAAVKADTAVQGDDEAKILTKLAELQAAVAAITPVTPSHTI
jgi:hypothetical protein